MARPQLGQSVLFTRAPGETFAARITRVVPTRVTPFTAPLLRGGHTITTTAAADASPLEDDYDVWISYAAHDGDEAAIAFAQAVPYDPGAAAGTWAWPPNAR